MNFPNYLLVFALCFAVSGALFGLTVLLQTKVVKKEVLWPFCMPFAALIPAVAVILLFKRTPFNFASLGAWKLWMVALGSAVAAAFIVQLKKERAENRAFAGLQCLEGASMEIVQRVFMQTLALGLIRGLGLKEPACILINACVFAADIFVQALACRERNYRNTLVEAAASFVFSMGIGYVFYASGCFVIPMLAHAAERLISAGLRNWKTKKSRDR